MEGGGVVQKCQEVPKLRAPPVGGKVWKRGPIPPAPLLPFFLAIYGSPLSFWHAPFESRAPPPPPPPPARAPPSGQHSFCRAVPRVANGGDQQQANPFRRTEMDGGMPWSLSTQQDSIDCCTGPGRNMTTMGWPTGVLYPCPPARVCALGRVTGVRQGNRTSLGVCPTPCATQLRPTSDSVGSSSLSGPQFSAFSAISQFFASFHNCFWLVHLAARCCHRFWQQRGLFGLLQVCKTCMWSTKDVCGVAY